MYTLHRPISTDISDIYYIQPLVVSFVWTQLVLFPALWQGLNFGPALAPAP
jgi:hypothetical protein